MPASFRSVLFVEVEAREGGVKEEAMKDSVSIVRVVIGRWRDRCQI